MNSLYSLQCFIIYVKHVFKPMDLCATKFCQQDNDEFCQVCTSPWKKIMSSIIRHYHGLMGTSTTQAKTIKENIWRFSFVNSSKHQIQIQQNTRTYEWSNQLEHHKWFTYLLPYLHIHHWLFITYWGHSRPFCPLPIQLKWRPCIPQRWKTEKSVHRHQRIFPSFWWRCIVYLDLNFWE